MFIKLVVLILVCGSSGIGLLSVRQSRLQAAHEMAEARHRVRLLEEQSSELRVKATLASSPEMVASLIENWDQYEPLVHQITITQGQSNDQGQVGYEPERLEDPFVQDQADDPIQDNPNQSDSAISLSQDTPDSNEVLSKPKGDQDQGWVLSDGTRVIVRKR